MYATGHPSNGSLELLPIRHASVTQETKMRRFKVAIVERGKEDLWRDYWTSAWSGDTNSAPSGLGRTEVVEATSVAKAIQIVQRRHPDCTIMLAGVS
jgi:hypothetical protein